MEIVNVGEGGKDKAVRHGRQSRVLFLVSKRNSVRGFVRPSIRWSVRGSRVFRKPQIQVNSSKLNKIQQKNSTRLFATVGRVTALFHPMHTF